MRRLSAAMLLAVFSCGPVPGVDPAGADGGDAGSAPDGGTGGGTGGGAAGSGSDGGSDPLVLARPYQVTVPAAATSGTPVPLVLLLHGYTESGAEEAEYFNLPALALARGFVLAAPDGRVDGLGQRFWNATDACCDLGGTGVDDVAYLTAVIDDVKRRFPIDAKRVFVAGHSNGGFMAHRLACDRAERVAAIVALAGDVWKDAARCAPTTGVSVLQVHGTADEVIAYGGGWIVTKQYPSAHESVSTWATKNHCTGALASGGAALDLVSNLAGAETRREAYGDCPAGSAAELWTIEGGAHVPTLNEGWAPALYDWMLAHPKL